MNLFISWSKAQSKTVASALHNWLPSVLPGIDPWMSSKDIDKGRDWFRELQDVLCQTRLCLICVTPDTVRSPWIYYEVGAIAGKDSDVFIYPFLVGVSPSMLSDGPLGKWQCTLAEADDTWELIKSLNNNALSSPHDLSLLEGNYRARWPVFLGELQPVLQAEEDLSERFVQTDADYIAGVNLSPEARSLIIEASQDPRGRILCMKLRMGTYYQTNRKSFPQDQSPRSIAKWKSARDTLLSYGLIEALGHKGEVFALTDRGYEVADLLRGSTIS